MLGILSLTWYISAKEEIEDESRLIWEEDSQLSFFFVLNSKFCTFNEGVQFQQFLRRCRVEFLAIFESDGQAEIIILEGVEMNHHDIKHSSTGSRWNKEIFEEKSTLSNVFITKKHKPLPQQNVFPSLPLGSQLFPLWKPGADLPLLSAREAYGMELSDEDVAKLLAKDIDQHKSKAPSAASHFLCWKICSPPKKGMKLQMDIFMWKPKKR